MVGSPLLKKFIRDMNRAKGQFLSIILLSALGVLVFSGLDCVWRNIELSINRYFEEQKLADFWVLTNDADSRVLNKIAGLEGVSAVQGRFSGEVEAKLTNEPKLMLHAVDGNFRVNVPRLISGRMISGNDLRGCLLDGQFAKANGLKPDDRLTIKIANREYTLVILGLVMSPEYVSTAKDITPDPKSFGYVYANKKAFTVLPMNEICVLLRDHSGAAAVKRTIERELPDVFVRERKAHKSTEMIDSEVTQFRSLTGVFPMLVFAVSALIVLTTMRRTVDNQRTQIGILKALGYGRRKITFHYLSYGLFPSLGGSVLGLAAGRSTLPIFFWNVESELYVLPEMQTSVMSVEAVMVCALSVAMTCMICYFTCRRNIRETSAELLRPKAPKAGNRILLERIPALWSSFRFKTKMIQRNIFRSKARTVMAMMGVLSCTALIITAFGLSDSIGNLIDTYYGKTLRYDLRAKLDQTAGSADAYRKRIPAETSEAVMEKVVNIRGSGENSRTVLLTVYEEGQKILYLGTDTRSDKNKAEGVLMSTKLAEVMGLSNGDELFLKLPGEMKEIRLVINGLVPVQIGQGIYMSDAAWKALGKGDFKPSALLVANPANGCVEYLKGLDEVSSVQWLSERRDKTYEGLQGMNSISMVLAVFALILAFVVLYNMGILNFIERIREFATLKVLGFHQREIRSLIIRENALITVIGIAAGVLPGQWLTVFVMKSAEPDDMVFLPYVSILSIAAACAITFVFSLLIQRLLTVKVKTIDMVEALKSVE